MSDRNGESNGMRNGLWMLGGVCLGAGLMCLFDPARGKRRRTFLLDQYRHATREAQQAFHSAGRALRHLNNQAYGKIAEAGSALRQDEPDDETLVARVRARIGHVIARPSAVDVRATGGSVALSGTIAPEELNDLLMSVADVRGVSEVESNLKFEGPASVRHNIAAAQ